MNSYSPDINLFFDADYTTRAVADGIKPTREYVTVGQLLDRQEESETWLRPGDGLWGAGHIARHDHELFDEMTKERDLMDLQEYEQTKSYDL